MFVAYLNIYYFIHFNSLANSCDYFNFDINFWIWKKKIIKYNEKKNSSRFDISTKTLDKGTLDHYMHLAKLLSLSSLTTRQAAIRSKWSRWSTRIQQFKSQDTICWSFRLRFTLWHASHSLNHKPRYHLRTYIGGKHWVLLGTKLYSFI